MSRHPIQRDPIVAIATPPGKGGIGIVRLSGRGIESFCFPILHCVPKPRLATYTPFFDDRGGIIDEGIVLYFPCPASFTGEDTLELHAHGGRVVLEQLLTRALELGARIARPGEFTERAFLNGKIDLLQAEAIADLIEASTERAARSARQALQGAFSEQVNELRDELVELRVYIEAAIDFSDEDLEFLSDGTVSKRLFDLEQRLGKILSTARQGCLLREGMTLVIAGRPNSGKSSLLNALARKETAIVTAQPGTTRDILREVIEIDGMPVHIVDTAGLRVSEDPVEREGIRRAHQEIDLADRILWMIDGSNPEDRNMPHPPFASEACVTKLLNKIDLTGEPAGMQNTDEGTEIFLSVRTGEGLDLLLQHLKDSMGYNEQIDDVFIARRRHIDALNIAASRIRGALNQCQEHHNPELVAEELRLAQQSLAEITGEFTSEDLLGKIFSSFCIGK